jgi:hypothetical protein
MKLKYMVWIIFTTITLSVGVRAQIPNTNPPDTLHTQTFDTNNFRLRNIEDQLAEVRHDELNYSIEKDLLKEAYGWNAQTMTIILTFSLRQTV